MNKLKKSLIITLPPDIFGGVGTKAKILADYLQSEGHKTTIAYYRPLRRKSELNVSFWQIPWRLKPEVLMESSFGGHDCRVVGCYFPEFEPSFSRPSSLWEDLVKCHDLHFVVGGTPVLANILETLDVPYIVWCGSDLVGDRWNRQIVMPIIRRFLDRKIVMPFLLSHQKRVINGKGRVLAVSKFTQEKLEKLNTNTEKSIGILNIPTDLSFFVPPKKPPKVARLGFAGRLCDPRKNTKFLFCVLSLVKEEGLDPELVLTGDSTPELDEEIRKFNISDSVFFKGKLNKLSLLKFYQSLDLFLIPSFQEGLAIVGIEAMACGVPVISTRCGGPEGYILDSENGFLVSFDPTEMARKVCDLIRNREDRKKLSGFARIMVEQKYGLEEFRKMVQGEIEKTWKNGNNL